MGPLGEIGDRREAFEDNCDTVWNPGQRDFDGDGVGDECDACPHVPNEFERNADGTYLHDGDGDGVIDCLDYCENDNNGGDTISDECSATERGQQGDSDCDGICDEDDPCRYLPILDPQNSNVDAERRWDATTLTDLCDPVLVPRGEVDLDRVSKETLASFNGTNVKIHVWKETRAWVKRTHLMSRGAGDQRALREVAIPVYVTQTDSRFCQPGTLVPDCRAAAAIHQGQLVAGSSALDEQKADPYHRITLNGASRDGLRQRDFDGSSEDLRWDYEFDVEFWRLNDLVDVPDDEAHPFLPEARASGLAGTMWFHAGRKYGHPGDADNDIGSGIHTAANPEVDDSEQLASSYFDVDPESIQESQQQLPFELDKPYFKWLDLPYPQPDELSRTLWGINPWDHLSIFETTLHEFGYLDREGSIRPLTDVLGEGLQESLADDSLVWASSAEPSAALRWRDAPMAVALTADGTAIAERVRSSPSGLLGEADRVKGPTAFAAAAAIDVADPLQDFVPVYASSRGWVFLVGGRAGIEGPRGIRRFDTETGESFDLALPLSLGTILAATFDPWTREVVILDEAPGEIPARARLLRIAAGGRKARVVDSWRRHHRYDDLSLLVDGTGRLLLAASDDHPRRHRVLELAEGGGRVRARKVVGGNARLATSPWSNEVALFLATEQKTGGVTLVKVPLVDAAGEEDAGDLL